jgi:hypothetical protein
MIASAITPQPINATRQLLRAFVSFIFLHALDLKPFVMIFKFNIESKSYGKSAKREQKPRGYV